ncbi:hypothetical protein [Kroppenstedtia sanguinis]|uniref:Uncharacterized protein n=1 Tax=Kroppenstedtia sanguinis TaxID=1380684 RepID=A0ABW4CGC3_9BACL
MRKEYYEYWDLPSGTPDGPLTEIEAKKLHDEQEMYVVVFKEGESPKFVVKMQFRTWYCTVFHLNENRRDKILEAYSEMYDMYDKTGVGIPKGIDNQIFLRNRQEQYFDMKEWVSWLFETNGKYRRVHRKSSGEIIEREEGIERVDKLIKDKPEFGNYWALLPEESWS